jgi:hypothetical protein
MDRKAWGQRFATAAVETALEAFWVAAGGAVITSLAAVVIFLQGSPGWAAFFAGAFAAFLIVLMATSSIVLLKKQSQGQPARQGKRGFLDSARDARRAQARILGNLNILTFQLNEVGSLASKGSQRINRLVSRAESGSDVTEAAHSEAASTAKALMRHASVMKLRSLAIRKDLDLLVQCIDEQVSRAVSSNNKNWASQLVVELSTLIVGIDGGLPGITAFRDSTEKLRWVSSDLDLAGEDLAEPMNLVAGKLSQTRESCEGSLQTLTSINT